MFARLRTLLPQHAYRLVPESSVRDLGFDSIELVELLCIIEDEFRVKLSDAELSSAGTLEELIGIVSSKMTEK